MHGSSSQWMIPIRRLNQQLFKFCTGMLSSYHLRVLWQKWMAEMVFARYNAFLWFLLWLVWVIIIIVSVIFYYSILTYIHRCAIFTGGSRGSKYNSLYLNAKSSARFLQEQEDRYISWMHVFQRKKEESILNCLNCLSSQCVNIDPNTVCTNL